MAGGIRLEKFRAVENLLPIFEILDQSTNLGAKEEALRILGQISADPDCRVAISQSGGISTLVEVLKQNPGQANTLVGPAVKTIRNLANDGIATRKALRQADATQCLMQIISQNEDSPVVVDSIAAVGYLAHHDPQTKSFIRKMGGIPLLVRILHADATKPLTCYAAAALHNLIDGSSRNKAALLAAGAVPRLVQLLDCEINNPVLEVAVRTLQKLSEKCDQAQSDIRRAKGLSKLIEIQTKVTQPSLLNWIEQCLQALKLSEKETDDSKVLLALGTAFHKEFNQIKDGSEQVLTMLRDMSQSFNASFQELNDRTSSLDEKNEQLRCLITDKDGQIAELHGALEEKETLFRNAEDVARHRESEIYEVQERLEKKESELTECFESLKQKETYLSKVEGLLQERDHQVNLLEAALEDKNQHIKYIETLVLEKERQINEALTDERHNRQNSKSERDAAILQLVQALREVVSLSPSTSPRAAPLDQQQICEISDSIQSLIQPEDTNLPQKSTVSDRKLHKDSQFETRNLVSQSPISRTRSVPVQSMGAGGRPLEANQTSLSKHLSLQPPIDNRVSPVEADKRQRRLSTVKSISPIPKQDLMTSPLSRSQSYAAVSPLQEFQRKPLNRRSTLGTHTVS